MLEEKREGFAKREKGFHKRRGSETCANGQTNRQDLTSCDGKQISYDSQ
jgi:hypothetical protein